MNRSHSRDLSRRARRSLLFLVPALLAATGTTFAAPPGNDDFTNALTITGGQDNVSGPTAEATKEDSEPVHAGNGGGASVWFRWTAPVSGLFTLDTIASDYDTLLAVYVGDNLGTLVPIAANDDNPGTVPRSLVRFNVAAGETYRIAVDGYEGATGAAVLSWSLVPAPANDNFSAAQVIAGRCGTVRNLSLAATREADEPNHGGGAGGHSVWIRWVAPADGPARFSTLGTRFDTVLGVYTGNAVGALTLVGENDDIVPGAVSASQVDFDAVAGTTYHIAVDGFGGAVGFWRVTWQLGPVANDDLAGAQMLAGSSGGVQDCNLLASAEMGEPSSGGMSLWYSWTAPADGTNVFNTYGSRFDTTLGIFTGTHVTNLIVVAQNDDVGPETSVSRAEFNATAGVTYRIVVDGYRAGSLTAQGFLRLNWSGTPASNDLRTNALMITGNTGFIDGGNFFGSREEGETNILGEPGGRSIWYAWTPAGRGVATLSTEGSAIDTLLGVYRDSGGGGLAVVADGDDIDANADFRQSRVAFAVQGGETYLIAIDGYAGEEGGIRLAWDNVPPPVLSVTKDATDVIVNWAGAVYQLEAAAELPAIGPPSWVRVPGPPPRRLPSEGNHRIFRAVFP